MHRMTVSFAAITAAIVMFTVASRTMAAIADTGSSQVKFIAVQSEVELTANFSQFSADVNFDPAHPQAGNIKVAIDVASVDAGGTKANNLLKGKDFLDVADFPGASFASSSIVPSSNVSGGAGMYQASGTFTLKGISTSQTIPFTVHTDAGGQWFEGSFQISRLAYKVGEGTWSDVSTLDDEVQVRFKLHMTH